MENNNLGLQKSLARGRSVIGIDIGFSSVNVAQKVIYKGKPTIIKASFETIAFVSDQEREKAVIDALRRVLADFNTSNADVICTVSNQKTIVDYVVMPMMPDSELAEAVKLEVTSSDHFSLEDPVVDFQVRGRVNEKGIEKYNIMIVAAARSSIDGLLSKFKPLPNDRLAFLKKVLLVEDLMGLNLTKVVPFAVALENIIKKSQAKTQETMAILEIGSMFGEFNIYRNGQLEFSRKINVTGLDFTRCLTSALSTSTGKIELTIEEAERIKKEHGIPSAGEDFLIKDKITANQVISMLRPKLEQLMREITRSFDFYYDKNRTGKIDKLVLLGGGAMLKRLPEFLNAELGLPVTLGNPFEEVNFLFDEVIDNKRDIHRLALAIGASLEDEKGINLLPEHLRDTKKNFIQKLIRVIAGFAFVVMSLVLYILLTLQLKQYEEEAVKLKSNYQTLAPALKDLKDKLTLQKSAQQRFDISNLLKELSFMPDKVFLTELNLDKGDLTLTGFIVADTRKSRKILSSLTSQLKKTSLSNIKVLMSKDVPKKQMLEFKISAKVPGGGS